jgi:cell division protein FtsL
MSNLNKWKLKIVNDSDSETLSETMRIFALFLCLFLLIISCGTLTYIYLLWNTYWIRVAKLSEERNFMRQQQQQNSVRVLEFDDQVKNWVIIIVPLNLLKNL